MARGSSIPRREAPELCKNLRPRKTEGAGNAGCALHPRSRVQVAQGNAHTSIQVQRRQSGIPCAMVLRLMPRSPRRRIRLVTVIGGLKVLSRPVGLTKTSADLTPATGARTTRFCRTQPPVFAKRLRRALAPSSACWCSLTGNPPCDSVSRLTLPRPPHPIPTFVTMANAPLLGTGWGELLPVICPTAKAEYLD